MIFMKFHVFHGLVFFSHKGTKVTKVFGTAKTPRSP